MPKRVPKRAPTRKHTPCFPFSREYLFASERHTHTNTCLCLCVCVFQRCTFLASLPELGPKQSSFFLRMVQASKVPSGTQRPATGSQPFSMWLLKGSPCLSGWPLGVQPPTRHGSPHLGLLKVGYNLGYQQITHLANRTPKITQVPCRWIRATKVRNGARGVSGTARAHQNPEVPAENMVFMS